MRILFVDLGSLLCTPDTKIMLEANIHRFFCILNKQLSVTEENSESNAVYIPLISFEYVPEHVGKKYNGPNIIYRRPFNRELIMEWRKHGYNLYMFPAYYSIEQFIFIDKEALFDLHGKVESLLKYFEEEGIDVTSYAVLIPDHYSDQFKRTDEISERVITFKDSNDCTDDLVLRVQDILYTDL